jgi:energy-coupling factor transporter ATP-binding protein EcfA2
MSAPLLLESFSCGHRRDVPVLEGISLALERGEVLALLGSNGAGKTTLLRAIAGLALQIGGVLRLHGLPAPRGAAARARAGLALSFQNPDDQLFGATVAEDVAIGPRQRGLAEAEVRREVEEALSATRMTALAARPIDALSFGEKRRACLAGVLALRPTVLLLDEPTAGLDPEGERDIAQLLARLASERGLALVVATHAVDLVPSFASRVALLGEGRLLLDAGCRTAFARSDLLDRARLRPPLSAEIWALLRGPRTPAGIPLTAAELCARLGPIVSWGPQAEEAG